MVKKKGSLSKPRLSKLKLTGVAATTVAIGASLFLSFGKGKPITVPNYSAIRVFDGDTFETNEKQYIRLSGINSPEMGQCGSDEAKKELEKLILGKKLYIKVLYHIGSRMMGLVYTDDGLVSTAMLASLHHGDRWFCTEKEARKAGFRKAETCPN